MPLNHEDYTVGWICALPQERAAAQGMLDEEHEHLSHDSADLNQYTLGRIGTHYVVLACLPAGDIGIVSTAILVTRMLSTFRRLQFVLLVGVGGGIPSNKHDIRLGDVVVGDSGVIQYDIGKTVQGGRSVWKPVLRLPSEAALLAVANLQSQYLLGKQTMMEYVDQMGKKHAEFAHPGVESDVLYHSQYDHPENFDSCDQCDSDQIVKRELRPSIQPVVHYGLIGSGSQVMRHGGTRDLLREQHDILCFEMEAAGLMRAFPALVIRGICDYSDTHKNKQWQNYASVAAAAYAKGLLSITQGPIMIETPCFMVPFQETSIFVGRKDIMAKIKEKLEAEHLVVLAGIGGVGKTQLAVRYCYKFREESPTAHVFWVNASTAANFERDYRKIAELLHIPGLEHPESDFCLEVCKRLSRDDAHQWVMVLDNLDDKQGLAAQMKFVPRLSRSAGSIIVTTRDMQVTEILPDTNNMTRDPISVPSLDLAEARILIESALSPQQRRSEDDLRRVLEILGCFPLALTQAVAFIKHERTTVTKYKYLLEHSDQSVVDKVHNAEYRDIHRYEGSRDSLYRTWVISFRQIKEENPHAADLLAWMSMFDTSLGVPELLLGGKELDDWELIKALGILKSFSLITDGPKDSLVMHLTVKKAINRFLDPDDRERYQNEALKLLANTFPDPKLERLEDCEELVPHAEKVLQYDFKEEDETGLTVLQRASLSHNVALYRNQRGRYQSAYMQAEEAYKIRQERLGDGSLESLASLELLALILVNQGKYKAAQEKQEIVLKLREVHEEKDHNKTLIFESQKLLADISLKLGRLDDAAKMYEEVLKASIELGGDMERNTLEIMDHFGEVLEHQNRFPEAETIYRKALSGKRITLGEKHQSTMKTKILLNMLLALRNEYEGNYNEAHKIYDEALEMSTGILGEKHPDTIRLHCNVASLYSMQRNWAKAEEVQLQAYRMFTEVLGENHPSTLVCQSNLAVLKQEQGQYADAEELHRTLWDRRRAVLGPQHPHTLTSMYHLAEVLTEREQYKESRDLLQEVLTGRRNVLGRKHPDTLRCLSSLAGAFYELQLHDDAESSYRECIQLEREVLGEKHPYILVDMNDLAEVLRQQSKLSEAERLLREVLQLHTEDIWNNSVVKGNLGRVLYLQGKYDEAIDLYQETLKAVEENDQYADLLSNRLEAALREKQKNQTVQRRFQGWVNWLIGGYSIYPSLGVLTNLPDVGFSKKIKSFREKSLL